MLVVKILKIIPHTFISGLGIATLACGMVVRLIVSFFAVWGTNLNMKERLFIPFAWLPKATVQVNMVEIKGYEKNVYGHFRGDIDN